MNKTVCLLLLKLLYIVGLMAGDSQKNIQEYELKAAFIYRFTEYIDWETRPVQGAGNREVFTICVLQESPVTNILTHITSGKTIKNKKIEVKDIQELSQSEACGVLFVPATCTISIENIIKTMSGSPVLIITEKSHYGKKGAHINFIVRDDKIRFEINQKSLEKSHLIASSLLLKHAILLK